MRDFLERLLQQLKAFFQQLLGGKVKSQSSISKSSPTASISSPRKSSTWVDRPISRYPSLPRKDLLIDKPFEVEPDRNKPANSPAQTIREQTHPRQPNSVPPSPTASSSRHQPRIRSYINYQIDALESLVDSNWNNSDILNTIHYELQFRSRRRSKVLRERITHRLSQLQNTPFSWPRTTATNGNQSLSSQVFRYEEGLLRHCGYRVGVNGLSEQQRRRILDDIYLHPLPPLDNGAYLREWGEPQTSQRLQKLAETIAAFTRNARRRNAHNLGTAIAHWESDLAYLKRTYYDRRFYFQWPHTA